MNFKIWLLNEMPLSAFTYKFQDPEPEEKVKPGYPVPDKTSHKQPFSHFIKRDRDIITNKLGKQLAEKFDATTKHNWNILLVEQFGNTSWGKYREFIHDYVSKHNIVLQNHITFAKNSSTGHPISPWMVAHTIGHAVFNTNSQAKDQITEVITPIINDDDIRNLHLLTNLLPFTSAVATSAGRMKSDRAIVILDELIYEMMAYYLISGDFKFKPNKYYDAMLYPHLKMERIRDKIVDSNKPLEVVFKETEQKIKSLLEKALDNCVGKVIIDHYSSWK